MKPSALFLLAGVQMCASAANADKIDDYVNAKLRTEHIPGISVAVLRNGAVVKCRGYGLANVELNVPATAATGYEIGSITKQFTATAVMMLANEGKLSLDATISHYLPGLPEAWSAVTIRQLLTHTSGIKGYTDVPDFEKTMAEPITSAALIKSVASYPLLFPSGTKWSYSNTNYYLLGLLIEKLSGKSYAAFLNERIFAPLHMNSTFVNDSRTIIKNRASGYEWSDGTLKIAQYTDMSWPFSAGAIVTTVEDLAKWDQALTAATLLPRSSLDQMWTSALLPNGASAKYGFGWFIDTTNGHKHVFHAGGIPGFVTYVTRYLEDNLTVIVLANREANTIGIGERIAGLYSPAVGTHPLKPIADTTPALTEQVRTIMTGLPQGRVDRSLFTPDTANSLETALKNGMAAKIRDLGPLRSLTLVERKDEPPIRRFSYRAVYTNGVKVVRVSRSSDDRITLLRGEDE